MDSLESAKLEQIGRQAMNIQVIESVFRTCNSDGEPIEGTETVKTFIYNLEKISVKEVEKALNDGSYMFDDRILETDPARFANIFPHAGESKKDFPQAYWKSKPCKGDSKGFAHCECSVCGFTIETKRAVEQESDFKHHYTQKALRYRYCPACGATMAIVKEDDQDGQE